MRVGSVHKVNLFRLFIYYCSKNGFYYESNITVIIIKSALRDNPLIFIKFLCKIVLLGIWTFFFVKNVSPGFSVMCASDFAA